MIVRVTYEPSVKAQLVRWIVTLGPTHDARIDLIDLATIYMTAFRQAVEAAGGAPAGALTDPSTDPPTYWFELTGGMWLQLVVQTTRTGPFGRFSREVVVVQAGPRPPLSAGPASPRS